ncbi:PREDICTED: arrestin-C isoform X2 [Cercocebus atys]|uniref:arrestin-C isoform X2 n=1 Tax=Cercocebus atys TaxID=9531 RepID=UPI0005F4038C|nr:PREDICTED: arrestin-C isoform X2 [Cercocebus atys]
MGILSTRRKREMTIELKRLNINYIANMSKVFKKTSSNGKLSIYLGKRDFVDHVDMVEPIDGVVLVDPEYLKGRKLFVMLTCAFRYGRDDLEVIGLTFRKDLYVQTLQVVPAESSSPKGPLTVLQERLLHKLGDNAYPFTLQPCGIDFEVKSFCAENPEETVSKRDYVRLVVRKVQFAPPEAGPGPSAQTIRRFLLSAQPLQLQAWMDSEVHYHGEPISVNVSINNCTNKVIKKIKISVDQTTDVVLYSLDKYSKTVFIQEFTETVAANSSFSQSFAVTPILAASCQKRGLALDGKLKHEDTNLASSTIIRPGMDKELLGILVSYKVRVNLMVSCGGILGDLTASDVGVELPLVLIHPKPSQEAASSEDIVIEEFTRKGEEENQKAAEAEGDEGS